MGKEEKTPDEKGSGEVDKRVQVLTSMVQPFFQEICDSRRVLLCGCGGGYDFFSALPLFLSLRSAGVDVYLGNLTFSSSEGVDGAEKIGECCLRVVADSKRVGTGWTPERDPYWPELHLAQFLKRELGEDIPVFQFNRTGVLPLRDAYQAIVDRHEIDTVVVVDGGTDSLMFGDEEGLGTPTEDMMTIGAVDQVEVAKKFLLCLGMGVDCFHGVAHNLFLENVATLARDGAFLGSWSLTSDLPAAETTRRAYEACKPENSIVTSSVMSAVAGEFGNFHHPATAGRTQGSTLFISALMSQYWAFRLEAVAKQVKYLKKLRKTKSATEVRTVINAYRAEYHKRGEFTGKRVSAPIPY